MIKSPTILCLFALGAASALAFAQEGAAAGLRTSWTPNPDLPLPEHPRPHLVRASWTNLNGMWEYRITGSGDAPQGWTGQDKILVPFPLESQLSGVTKGLQPDEYLWYRKIVDTPELERGGRLFLHFGAVDWRADVWVNGTSVGSHEGGYDAFTFDVTDAVGDADRVELLVRVQDPTDTGTQPRGKQVLKPGGIWYTPVSGIWQTVWFEAVPATWIDGLSMNNDLEAGSLTIQPRVAGEKVAARYEVNVMLDGQVVGSGSSDSSRSVTVRLTNARPWSPDSPTLYDLDVKLLRDRTVIDSVRSYAAFRTVEMRADDQSINRLFVNGEPLFMFGPLDQGWWPDGLYTAPTDDALRFDIEQTRAMGFNMCRKHVKVEPQRWYYWADRLGLMVWQDMPSGDRYIRPDEPDIERTAQSEAIYRKEWQEIVRELQPHPSIVAWVPFNEGWGQFKTNEILTWTKSLDPSRLVDGPSGWADRDGGDMHDMHAYPGPGMFPVSDDRGSVLGEFGGLGLVVRGHLWQEDRNWGYRSFESNEELTKAYAQLVERLRPLIGRGLCAAVYTQTTDVEVEVNGLMTYDRKITKMDLDALRKINQRVYLPPPIERTIVPTSQDTAQAWRYTLADPGEGWTAGGFDDSHWETGKGGFGSEGTPGAVIGTPWSSSDIWIRREVGLEGVRGPVYLRMHHDENAEAYINGKKVVETTGWTTGYTEFGPIGADVLRVGANTIAVHCHQTSGGQFIDVGLVQVIDPAGRID